MFLLLLFGWLVGWLTFITAFRYVDWWWYLNDIQYIEIFLYTTNFRFNNSAQSKVNIIYWYQSDDVVVRTTHKSVVVNVDTNTMDATDIVHTPFDDILMLWPFRSSRIKSANYKHTQLISKHGMQYFANAIFHSLWRTMFV